MRRFKGVLMTSVVIVLLLTLGALSGTLIKRALFTRDILIVNGKHVDLDPGLVSIETENGTSLYAPLNQLARILGLITEYDDFNEAVYINGSIRPYQEEILAVVNGQVISMKQFYDALEENNGLQILQEIINETLLMQEAKKAGVEISDYKVEREIANVRANLGDQFDYVLSMYGMTEESLRVSMKQNLLAYEISTKDIVVTDEQIEKEYYENPDYYKQPAQVRASHILVSTKEEAQAILDELKKITDPDAQAFMFYDLAIVESIDRGTAIKGGDLGYFGAGQMAEAFEKAAFALSVGQLSPIVETEYGFNVILLTDKKAENMPTLEEARDKVIEKIKGASAKNIDTLLEEIRNHSLIKVTKEKYSSLGILVSY